MPQPLMLTSPSQEGEECHNHHCQQTLPSQQENAATFLIHLPQTGNREVQQAHAFYTLTKYHDYLSRKGRMPHLNLPTCPSRLCTECSIGTHQFLIL